MVLSRGERWGTLSAVDGEGAGQVLRKGPDRGGESGEEENTLRQ